MKKSESLFDALIEEINNDIGEIYPAEVLSVPVDYNSGRGEGCEARFNSPRLAAMSTLVPGLKKRFIGFSKLNKPTLARDLHRLACEKFLADNERCRLFNASFSVSNLTAFQQLITGEMSLQLQRILGSDQNELSYTALSHYLRVGPGASSDVTGDPGLYGRLGESIMSFSSSDVRSAYTRCTMVTKLTFDAELLRRHLTNDRDVLDSCAKFLTVPKSSDEFRGICTQPSGNMCLQLATHELLAKVLKSEFDVDLEVQQELNRSLAYYGSKGQVGFLNNSWNFCTVDLKSASNFPWILIETLFPYAWSSWLSLIRSSLMEIECDGDKTVVHKHMCSTMGNGFTFSLMTLLFSSLVSTLYTLAGLPHYDYINGKKIKTWAVYGDDLIIDRSVFDGLMKSLRGFGFIVNVKKTFSTGYFRESCGADYYDGYPVRPVFVETLQTQQDIFSLLNRLIEWSAVHSVPLPRSVALLRNSLISEFRIPWGSDVSAGFCVPASHMLPIRIRDLPSELKSFAKDFQVKTGFYECMLPSPKRRFLWKEKQSAVKYTDTVTKACYAYCSSVSWDLCRNPILGLLGTISGDIRKGAYAVRPIGFTPYKKQWKYVPSWNYFALTSVLSTTNGRYRGSALRHWETWFRINTECVPRT